MSFLTVKQKPASDPYSCLFRPHSASVNTRGSEYVRLWQKALQYCFWELIMNVGQPFIRVFHDLWWRSCIQVTEWKCTSQKLDSDTPGSISTLFPRNHFLGGKSHSTSANDSVTSHIFWVFLLLVVSVGGKMFSRLPPFTLISFSILLWSS